MTVGLRMSLCKSDNTTRQQMRQSSKGLDAAASLGVKVCVGYWSPVHNLSKFAATLKLTHAYRQSHN